MPTHPSSLSPIRNLLGETTHGVHFCEPVSGVPVGFSLSKLLTPVEKFDHKSLK